MACSGKQEPAPPLAVCNAETCNPQPITAGGSTGGASNGGAGSTSGVTLSISVVQFAAATGKQAWSPQSVQELGGVFSVRASGVNGSLITQSGNSPVQLQNVIADGTGWVTVTPSTDSGYFPGIHVVPLDPGSSLSVPLLRIADFDFVPTLLSTKALALDMTEHAQLALKFVDASGAGVSGLTVASLGGDSTAYAKLGNWVDSSVENETDTSGRVIGINIPASKTAINLASVSVSGVTAQGAARTITGLFPFMAGFVTYGTLLFE